MIGRRSSSLAFAALVSSALLIVVSCSSGTPAPSGPSCGSDQTACGTACVSTATDNLNCGTGAGGSGGTGGTGGSRGMGGAADAGGAAGSGGTGGAGGGTSAGETLPGPTFVTSAQGSYWQTGTTTTVTSGTATLTVNDGTTYQTFDGFG